MLQWWLATEEEPMGKSNVLFARFNRTDGPEVMVELPPKDSANVTYNEAGLAHIEVGKLWEFRRTDPERKGLQVVVNAYDKEKRLVSCHHFAYPDAKFTDMDETWFREHFVPYDLVFPDLSLQ